MPSPFAAAAAAAAATHDRLLGDLFDYRPMKTGDDPGLRPFADPDRAIVTDLRMPFSAATARAGSGPVNTPAVKPERPGHASDRPFVALQLSLLPYDPRKGDRLAHRDSGDLYRVAEVVPSIPGFVRLDLNQINAG
jgi:hypothetical protein